MNTYRSEYHVLSGYEYVINIWGEPLGRVITEVLANHGLISCTVHEVCTIRIIPLGALLKHLSKTQDPIGPHNALVQ